ncbi:NAD-dependent epimerase/dehydratase family protein [Acetobacter sp.]|uniref:NAD-dependent epimerase/dehydratase family protein n=1 Tax=Acetobacter sp. TaxID=440 RepID=UPI0039EC1255
MHILIIGNMGYVGSVVSQYMRETFQSAYLSGFDSALFAHCLVGEHPLPEISLNNQLFGDVRDLDPSLFEKVDAVIYLAAISNDPMGQQFEVVTDIINKECCILAAKMALDKGVKHFVLASSCSVYGAAAGSARTELDSINPLTAYAKSKVAAEEQLAELQSDKMFISCLRFATACGFSQRLRLDLVLNDFVASALTTGKISILSDGTPWRPLIDVIDMARIMEWAVTRSGDPFLIVNAGRNSANYTVKELADYVADALPGTEITINEKAQPDKRSYKVDFSALEILAPDYLPRISIATTIKRLIEGIKDSHLLKETQPFSRLVRLHTLKQFMEKGVLDQDIRWTK